MEDLLKNKEEIILKLKEELKLRKYSPRTIDKYTYIICKFLNSGKSIREFLLAYSDKSRSSARTVYFALQFLYKNILNIPFKEKVPLIKRKITLPNVINKKEVTSMISSTKNMQHRLILMFLYYSGLRLHELLNLKWENLDFERKTINLKIAKRRTSENYIFA
ncbi:MAG: tyrosine-type recombinase/integrase [Candidatus Pacearchaeota archaeon]